MRSMHSRGASWKAERACVTISGHRRARLGTRVSDMNATLSNVIYGPVPSWRLGRSLGVDMVSQPEKTCSFDCVYCQLGPTRCRMAQRREFVSLARLREELGKLPPLEVDYVTFSGTGEPTLAANLGEAITAVKERLPSPVAVLTNSSLISDPSVRADLGLADVVVAKLDAPTEALFQAVNRPAPGIRLAGTVEALHLFRQEYQGRLSLQMMFFNANEDCAEALAALARELGPDEVQVNTPLRPCPVQPLSPQAIGRILPAFSGLQAVSVYEAPRPKVHPLDVQETAARRPEARSAAKSM
jgi:wyosine [tRNA(Phe)-imidazoG37] synthetase (radical SAM superfamily)